MKLAFIGLDKIIANIDARLDLAERVRQNYIKSEHAKLKNRAKKVGDALYWDVVLNSKYLYLDTLIKGTPEALKALERQGYMVLFLTPRPEHMRGATEEWMKKYDLLTSKRRLIMKPESARKRANATWAVERLHEIASLKASEVLLIDEEAICQELASRTGRAKYSITSYSNLTDVNEIVSTGERNR